MDNGLANGLYGACMDAPVMDTPAGGSRTMAIRHFDLKGIDALVQTIIGLKTDVFYLAYNGKDRLGCPLYAIASEPHGLLRTLKKYAAPDFARQLDASFPLHRFNPYIDLFFKAVRQAKQQLLRGEGGYWALPSGHGGGGQPGEKGVDDIDLFHCPTVCDPEDLMQRIGLLNHMLHQIRAEANSGAFKALVSRHHRQARNNAKSLSSYIAALFQRYARLLVIRVDFGYRKQERRYTSIDALQAELQQVQSDREHFFNNTRTNALFGHKVGHVWKLEYGMDKGFHYHLLFFYDGSKVREDITLGHRLGRYWADTITGGRGIYFNCNAQKKLYARCGIGRVNHDDTELRDNLDRAARYLVKQDCYAAVIVQGEGRVFGKGQAEEKHSSRGRPRRRVAERLAAINGEGLGGGVS